ncbi:hypothetical protein H920_15095 [Fukomys damarensis]|uniref:Uncharacterized protein n=1 Tax=Fukomys damarensis TaxID=885580 RepID=A0A091CXR4_FUKDA|nr:hypothetical protein H920_15095 [Fukomys damarensis]
MDSGHVLIGVIQARPRISHLSTACEALELRLAQQYMGADEPFCVVSRIEVAQSGANRLHQENKLGPHQ